MHKKRKAPEWAKSAKRKQMAALGKTKATENGE